MEKTKQTRKRGLDKDFKKKLEDCEKINYHIDQIKQYDSSGMFDVAIASLSHELVGICN